MGQIGLYLSLEGERESARHSHCGIANSGPDCPLARNWLAQE